MSDLSRREFFRRFTHDVADQVDLEAAKKMLAKMPMSTVSAPTADWVAVGRMAEFAPGVVREVSVGAVTLTFQSRADGLWVERAGAQRVALRTGPGGVVLANVTIDWPPSRMLSHLTGEPIDADLQDTTRATGEFK